MASNQGQSPRRRTPPRQESTVIGITPYLQPRSGRRPPPPVPHKSPAALAPPQFETEEPNDSAEIIVRRPKRPPPGTPRNANASPPNVARNFASPLPYTPNTASPPFQIPGEAPPSQRLRQRSPNYLPRDQIAPTSNSTTNSISSSGTASTYSFGAPSTPSKGPSTPRAGNYASPQMTSSDSPLYNASTNSTARGREILSPPNAVNDFILVKPISNSLLSPAFSPSATSTLNASSPIECVKSAASSPTSFLTLSPASENSPDSTGLQFLHPKMRTFWQRMQERMQLEQNLKKNALDTLYLHAKQPDLVALTQTQLVRTYERIEIIYQGMIQFLSNNQKQSEMTNTLEAKRQNLVIATERTERIERTAQTDEQPPSPQTEQNSLALAYEELQLKYNEQSAQFAELLAKTINQPFQAESSLQSNSTDMSNEQVENGFDSNQTSLHTDCLTSPATEDEFRETRHSNQYNLEKMGESLNTSKSSGTFHELELKLEASIERCKELESEIKSLQLQANAHQDVLDLAYSREAELQEMLMQLENAPRKEMVDQSVLTDLDSYPPTLIDQEATTSRPDIADHTEALHNLEQELKSSIQREMDLKLQVLEAREMREDIENQERRYKRQIDDMLSELDSLRALLKEKEDAALEMQMSKTDAMNRGVVEEMKDRQEAAEQQCLALQEQLDQLQGRLEESSQLTAKNTKLEMEHVQLKAAMAELKEEKYELEQSLEKIDKQHSQLVAELSTIESRYQSDLTKMEAQLAQETKEKETYLNEFDIMVMQSTEWMEKCRNLDSKLEKLEKKMRETESELEDALALGPKEGSHIQLRAEFRKQLEWIQTEHRRALDLEIQEKSKMESDFRDFKKEIRMQKYKRVTTGSQTYSIYAGVESSPK